MANNERNARQSIFSGLFNTLSEYREKRREDNFINSLPKQYGVFFESFVPQKPAETEMYNKIKNHLSKAPRDVDLFREEFSQIGDAQLLGYIWRNTPENEPDTRKLIINNPNCPKEIILEAVEDPYDLVAEAAINHPSFTEEDCIEAFYRVDENCYSTIKTLETKLNDYGYGIDWEPWNGEFAYLESESPILYRIKEDGSHIPLDTDLNEEIITASENSHEFSDINDLISDANSRAMVQKPSRPIVVEKNVEDIGL